MGIEYNKTNTKLSELEMAEIRKIVEGGQVVNGEYTDTLERVIMINTGVKHVIACANCTSGLIIALKAVGIEEKVVALPAFTWYSTGYAVGCTNNKLFYCDVNMDTWLIEDDYTYADVIIAVDTFGNQANVITDKPVIYDAAHGYGLPNLGHRGLVEVISLSFTKVTTGMQGGIILTNSDEIAERVRNMVHRYAKLCEINALVAFNSIRNYEKNRGIRQEIIDEYRWCIKVPYREQVIPEYTNNSVYSIMLDTNEERDDIARKLSKNDIGYKIYYEPLMLRTNAHDIYSRIISLPVHQYIDVERVCEVINS